MDNKRVRAGGAVVGGSSLLVIFAVLCLTVFALLSLSTVQADGRLSETTAESVRAYYAADRAAEEVFARIRGGEIPADVVPCACGGYAYACPISDTQALAISVRLDRDHYTVLRWQAVSTIEWTPDESIDLWDGES